MLFTGVPTMKDSRRLRKWELEAKIREESTRIKAGIEGYMWRG